MSLAIFWWFESRCVCVARDISCVCVCVLYSYGMGGLDLIDRWVDGWMDGMD